MPIPSILKQFRSPQSQTKSDENREMEVYDNPMAVQIENEEKEEAKEEEGLEREEEEEAERDQTEKIEKEDVISTDLQDGDDLASLLRKVAGRMKVKQAAILDRNGVIEHVTSGWDLQPDDSRKLGQVMNSSPVRGLWKMAVFGEDFMCSHCDPVGTIIGHTVTREKVMAARITQNHIIVGLAPAQMPGSCLHEMKQLWEAIEARGL